jgi:hypothetical protein
VRYGGWLTLADRYRWTRPLVELMRSMTQREYDLRMAWIAEDRGRPDRSDSYAMQTAAEVRKLRVDPGNVRLEHMELRLKKVEPEVPLTKGEATARAKAKWFGMLGIKR